MKRWPSMALVLLTLACTRSETDAPGGASAGRDLVEQYCLGCHTVATGTKSRHPDAPALADVARRYPPEDLAEALAEGIAVGHHESEMPEFAFEPAEIDNIIAYLDSLRR
ncbi:MAG: cytochrome c [Alphaproteobacteria bacterium]|nr:cytochrome c [Alphaproteobacteria bacterium]